MTLEERILKVAEGPNWHDSSELRAIALEVRKREDRIKQLEEMYEGVIGERPELLGSNVMGLLKRELNFAQKRIKRLEEAGDELIWAFCPASVSMMTERESDALKLWNKAKEAKP